MATIPKSVLLTMSIIMSAAFVGSAYVPGLGFVANVLAPFVWGIALVYLLAGAYLLLMSKVGKFSLNAPVPNPASERRPIPEGIPRHNHEYAVGMALVIALTISIAVTERYWLSVCYLASFSVFRFGMRSLKKRTGAIIRSLTTTNAVN